MPFAILKIQLLTATIYYTQYKIKFCDKVIFDLRSTINTLKVIGIIWGKPNKFQKPQVITNKPGMSNKHIDVTF